MLYPQYSKTIYCLCYLGNRNYPQCHTETKELPGGNNGPFSAVVDLGWQSTDESSDCSIAQNSLRESIEAMAETSSPSLNAGQTAPSWF